MIQKNVKGKRVG